MSDQSCDFSLLCLGLCPQVDRIYVGVPSELQIRDSGAGSTVSVSTQNFPDAVVWNPWVDKAKAMAAFGDDEYQQMVCVEPAVAASGPVTLPPGEMWSAKQVLQDGAAASSSA